MLTETQILEIRKRAKAKGISDAAVDKGINEYQKSGFNVPVSAEISTTAIPQATSQQPAAAPAPVPSSPIATMKLEEQEPGFIASFIKSLVDPAVNYLKFVGEAGFQGARAITDDSILSVDSVDSQIQDLTAKSQDLIRQAKQATNPKEKIRLLDESRKIDDQIDALGSKAGEVGNLQKTKFVDEEKIATRGDIIKTGVKATAGAMAYAVPAGKTLKTAAALGSVSGALFGLSEGDDIEWNNIVAGAAGGAAGGALAYGAGKVFDAAKKGFSNLNKLKAGAKENLSDLAAKRLNKASPSAWRTAIENHGMDLNELTTKYFPKGGSYDDLLGPIKERGTGGVLGSTMKEAEQQIQKELSATTKNTVIPIDDMVKKLQKEARLLAKLPGNEANAEAINAFIEGFKVKYGKGITPKAMLELKRVADSKFGKAVVDESAGSAVAQSQKMMANAARAKLKELFPKIAQALDTETEIYTIQPVMSHARAIMNTGGSEIRLGGIESLGDLIDPIKLMNNWLSKPENASKFLQVATKDVGDEAVKEITATGGNELFSNLLQVVGRNVGASAVTVNDEETDITDNTNKTNADENINSNQGGTPNGNLPQIDPKISRVTPSPMNPFGGLTKRQVLALALSNGAKASDLDEVAKIYDMMASDTDTISSETMGIANSLRSEYFSRTKENGFLDVTNSYKKVASAPNTPAGDVSIIFAYMKMIDPGSVVREGEFATAENTAGIPERIVLAYNKALQGKRLSTKQRQDFIKSTQAIYSQYQSSQAQIDALYQGLANKYGIDPSLIGIGTYQPAQ